MRRQRLSLRRVARSWRLCGATTLQGPSNASRPRGGERLADLGGELVHNLDHGAHISLDVVDVYKLVSDTNLTFLEFCWHPFNIRVQL